MKAKYRNNLKGSMSFKSYIPPEIAEYDIDTSLYAEMLESLECKFSTLRSVIESAGKDMRAVVMDEEARDSISLSDDRPACPFSFCAPAGKASTDIDNLLRATDYGAGALEELPLSTRLIKNLHYLVCDSPDYDRKYRGEYRTSPVWIGKKDCGIRDAQFIPPVGEDMTAAISDFEKYLNYNETNPFVKAAVLHYQFEMIHPFIDGNGRVGRIINTLFLLESGKLNYPVLLLSKPLIRSGREYSGGIEYVNTTQDINGWIKYFLAILDDACTLTISRFTPN